MSEATFQVGDEVEVLPAPEGSRGAWQRVSGMRGWVILTGSEWWGCSVRVAFPNFRGSEEWGEERCEPAWLRRVPGKTCGHWQVMKLNCGAWVCKDKTCWQEFTPGGWHDPNHDAPSRPQGARTGPSEGKPDSRAIGEPTPVAGPRYKVGDRVDGDEFEGGVVTSVETEPVYVVRWPSGYVQRIKESLLSPHRPAPVVCAPDGTRCAWMADQPAGSVHVLGWLYCPGCGGKLTAGG